ncbi:MAG: IclR family transcriptional regulator [Anaerolineae bacterium]
MQKKKSGLVQSIQRAGAILRCFSEAEPEQSVTELSRRLKLHKSTISRILSTLQAEGFVNQHPETGKYRLGVGLVSLAGVALGGLDVRGVAQPHLNRLVEISEETVNVTVLDGSECVNIERVASPKPVRYVGWIGRRIPLHCTASGKVLLACLAKAERQSLLPSPLKKYTPQTITNIQDLETSLAQVCEQGFAIVQEEFEEGFSDIAAPVFNHAREIVGAIAISGPTFRLGNGRIESFITPLLETADKVSADLGYKKR